MLEIPKLVGRGTGRDGQGADCAGRYEIGFRPSLFAIGSAIGRQIS